MNKDKVLKGIEETDLIRDNSIESLVKRLVQKTSDQIDRSNETALTVNKFNECLLKIIDLIFKQTDNQYVNIDYVTHKILIPLPWGSNGYKVWGLRQYESEIFRKIMLAISEGKRRDKIMFFYSKESRCWFFNLEKFSTLEVAITYTPTINNATYQTHYLAYKNRRNK